MEFLEKVFRKTGIISIIESLIFIGIGFILIWKSELALKVMSSILGIFFIIIGLINIIKCYTRYKDHFDIYNYELIYGLMGIVIGIVTIYYSNTIETILRIIIGIWIIYSSFVKFSLSMKIKSLGSNSWIYCSIFSLLMLGCGMFIILNSGAIIATIGIVMIIYSVIEIIEDIICMIHLRDII